MSDVVDSDELLRRMHRARACAVEEERAWRARGEQLRESDPDGALEAAVRTMAYQAVLRVLDEVLTPGRARREEPAVARLGGLTGTGTGKPGRHESRPHPRTGS